MDNGTEPNDSDAGEAADEAAQQPAPRNSSPNITGNIAPPTAEKKWYIVHTYSGHENKAKLTLLERVRNDEPDRVLR